jgi:Soluble lytic murein transglycosylase and related regulatory proteins (some contain LysM/invasin domains)
MDIRTGYRKPVVRNTLPMGIKRGIVGVALLVVLLLIAEWAMTGYLEGNKALKEAAQNKVIAEHPLSYRGWIESYAAQNNLEPSFVAAIIMTESSYRRDAVSSADARGLMQIKPDTGKWIAGKLSEEDVFTAERLFDPETNIRFGCWYLGYLAKLFGGDTVLVAAAYHSGQTYVQNLMAKGVKTLEDIIDGSTNNYARKVKTSYGIYERLYFAYDAEIGAAASQY